VIGVLPDGKRFSYDMGFVWAMGSPCVLESRSLPSQLLILPYRLGHGTGFATYDWCVITTLNDTMHVKHMGMWKYVSVSRSSTVFELGPALTRGTTAPVLDFVFERGNADGISVISGRVLLDIALREGKIDARLIPQRMHDFDACLRVLASDEDLLHRWVTGTLRAICPKQVGEYVAKRNKLTQTEKSGLLESMRKTAKSYYANPHG